MKNMSQKTRQMLSLGRESAFLSSFSLCETFEAKNVESWTHHWSLQQVFDHFLQSQSATLPRQPITCSRHGLNLRCLLLVLVSFQFPPSTSCTVRWTSLVLLMPLPPPPVGSFRLEALSTKTLHISRPGLCISVFSVIISLTDTISAKSSGRASAVPH